jgi:dTDP-4-amino-4,6-dideoxygalactose transaminase
MHVFSYSGSGLPLAAEAVRPSGHERLPLPSDATGIVFVDSGAAAMFAVLRAHARSAQPDSRDPMRVALPAYCCPTVLGAVLGAGWMPEFLDLAPGSVAFDDRRYGTRISGDSQAIIIVDLFGLPGFSDYNALRDLPAGVLPVHDLAQCYLSTVAGRPVGRGVGILSFGRGKPVSVLTGGAVIVGESSDLIPRIKSELRPGRIEPRAVRLARAAAYNVALNPLVYSGVRRIPGLSIGRVVLANTTSATGLPETFGNFIAGQNAAVEEAKGARSAQIMLLANRAEQVGLPLLAGSTAPDAHVRLSRIPVLAPNESYAARALAAAGHLGVTRMYGKTLPEFLGVDARNAEASWPNAFALSRRLLTLPAHGRLSDGAARRLIAILDHTHATE